jgi:hypothetical protein
VAQGPGNTPRRVFGVPGLRPWPDTFFELRDDLVGDAAVDVFAFVRVVHSVAPFPAFKKLHFLVLESALQGRTGRHRAERTRSSSQTLDGAKGGSDSGFFGRGNEGIGKGANAVAYERTQVGIISHPAKQS